MQTDQEMQALAASVDVDFLCQAIRRISTILIYFGKNLKLVKFSKPYGIIVPLYTVARHYRKQKNMKKLWPIVNFKGKLTKYIAKQTIVDNYPDRVLGLIRSNNALREVIKKKYFG